MPLKNKKDLMKSCSFIKHLLTSESSFLTFLAKNYSSSEEKRSFVFVYNERYGAVKRDEGCKSKRHYSTNRISDTPDGVYGSIICLRCMASGLRPL